MENLQIFEQPNPSFAELFAAMRGSAAADKFNAAMQEQLRRIPAPTHTGQPRPTDVVDLSKFRVFHAAETAMTAWIQAAAKEMPSFLGCQADYTAQTVTAIFTGNDANAVKFAQKTLLWATGLPDGFETKHLMKQLTTPASVCGVKHELFTAHAVFAYTPATAEAENTNMQPQKSFSPNGFGSPKRRDYRSHAPAPMRDTRPAKPAVKTGRPSKDGYLGKKDGDLLFRMELAKYAKQQAAMYQQTASQFALHEVLWATATRFFPQPVISYMKREITSTGFPAEWFRRDAQRTLQDLLPCFLAELKGNTLKLTVPPQGDADRQPDMNVIDGLLNAADLLDVVINRTLCQADEALTAVDMMTGADVADLIIETTPCLADEAWEAYAERLLSHAPAMTWRLREVVTEKLMTIPAVKASVAPDNEEA